MARTTDPYKLESLNEIGQEKVTMTTVNQSSEDSSEYLDEAIGQEKVNTTEEYQYSDEELGQEQVDFAENFNETEYEYSDEDLAHPLKTTKEFESRKTSHGLEGLQTIHNEPVSIIPGSENLLPALKAFNPSIKYATQILGMYLLVNKEQRAFMKTLKLDSDNDDVERTGKRKMFQEINNWCQRVENCQDI